MDRLVRKALFGELYNIQEYEEYFSEMSRLGLHLQEVGKFFAYFKEGKPQYLNYRIDVVNEDKKEGRIAKLRTKGWNFVCEKDSFLIFSSPEGSNLKELYDTPEEQKLAIKEANNKMNGRRLTNIILSIAGIGVVFYILYDRLFIRKNFYLSLNDGDTFISVISLILLILSRNRGRRSLEKLEKILGSNEFLRHQGDFTLLKSKFILRRGLYLLLVLTIVSGGIYKALQYEKIRLDEVENLESIPIATVEYIEKEHVNHVKGLYFRGDNIDYGNVLYKKWNLFIPKEYTIMETVTLHESNADKAKNWSYLIADYYLARFGFIAEGLLGDILYRESNRNPLSLISVRRESDLNIAYGTEIEDKIILLCRCGKQVIYLSYSNGTVSMEELAEIVMDKLESNSSLQQ
ncbi:MAG TPA: DUF2812 domain-containing protein [Tissierellia bacterium]|nr:DUF2812 domain-containing protein [Tissierellia bacterium]